MKKPYCAINNSTNVYTYSNIPMFLCRNDNGNESIQLSKPNCSKPNLIHTYIRYTHTHTHHNSQELTTKCVCLQE